MISLIPSVFATTTAEFKSRMRLAHALSSETHIDIMDGEFVSKSSPPIEDMPSLKDSQVHLMTYNPQDYFYELAGKRCTTVIVHYEAVCDTYPIVLKEAKRNNLACFLAVTTETPISEFRHIIQKFDGFLVMGIEPGEEHQTLDEKIFPLIRELRTTTKKPIFVDGGVRFRNADKLIRAGASGLVVGSIVFKSTDPKGIFNELRKRLN
jgi:pentose-5-phosphate-3-epimerase